MTNHRVFETKHGRVVLKSWDSYVSEGIGSGSMGGIAKLEGADMVLLVHTDLAACTDADAEMMAGETLEAVSRAKLEPAP